MDIKELYNLCIQLKGGIMRQLEKEYLSIIIQQFEHFKDRAELTFDQLTERNCIGNPTKNRTVSQ